VAVLLVGATTSKQTKILGWGSLSSPRKFSGEPLMSDKPFAMSSLRFVLYRKLIFAAPALFYFVVRWALEPSKSGYGYFFEGKRGSVYWLVTNWGYIRVASMVAAMILILGMLLILFHRLRLRRQHDLVDWLLLVTSGIVALIIVSDMRSVQYDLSFTETNLRGQMRVNNHQYLLVEQLNELAVIDDCFADLCSPWPRVLYYDVMIFECDGLGFYCKRLSPIGFSNRDTFPHGGPHPHTLEMSYDEAGRVFKVKDNGRLIITAAPQFDN
jgi:hypothetical protein